MKKAACLLVLLLISRGVCAEANLQNDSRAHMNFLTSPLLDGRKVGTAGEEIAAMYLQTEFERLGYDTSISSFGIKNCWKTQTTIVSGKNVIAVLKSSDLESTETIVLNAHYDGVGGKDNGGYRPAADDNASGTSALLVLAKKLKTRKWKRNIVLIAFSGEESGLCGSIAYVQNISTKNIIYDIQMDMVGRPISSTAPAVYVVGDDERAESLVSALQKSASSDLALIFGKDLNEQPWWRWSSDHRSFHNAGIISIMLTDGNPFSADGKKLIIHSSEDSLEHIDLNYLEKVTDLLFESLVELDKR